MGTISLKYKMNYLFHKILGQTDEDAVLNAKDKAFIDIQLTIDRKTQKLIHDICTNC